MMLGTTALIKKTENKCLWYSLFQIYQRKHTGIIFLKIKNSFICLSIFQYIRVLFYKIEICPQINRCKNSYSFDLKEI